MKLVKMAFMALAAVGSIGSAFAFNHAGKKNLTTYYAVQSGSSFIWQTTPPAHKSCQSTVQNVACTIVTATPPTNGQMPANQTVTNQVYR